MSSINQTVSIDQTYELLISCMMQTKHRLIQMAGSFNITGMQAMLILFLSKPCPMNSFTRIFNCDASNITGLVDGLEQKGLAARFPDTHDRRIKMIKLSSKGEKLRQQLVVLLDEDGRSSLANLKPSEINNFNKLLSRITEPIVL